MPISRSTPILILSLLLIGISSVSYLFGKEDIQNAYISFIDFIRPAQQAGPLTEDTLYHSFILAPVDWMKQMKKVKKEGFKDNPFIADILEFNPETNSLTLIFDYNYGGDFPQVEEIVTKAICPPEGSYIVSSLNLATIAEKTDIFAFINEGPEENSLYIEADDILMSYCLDDACSEIGRECVLVKIEEQESVAE